MLDWGAISRSGGRLVRFDPNGVIDRIVGLPVQSTTSLTFGGDIDFFIHTVFNYPTLGDVYKYAAYNALGKLNKAREAAAMAVNLANSSEKPAVAATASG